MTEQMAVLKRAHVYIGVDLEEVERVARLELGLALGLAAVGIAVMPVHLHRLGERWRKDPLIKDWRNRASTDTRMIKGWWRQFPWAVPGIVLDQCGLVVIDADRHEGKPDGVAALAAIEGLPKHPVVATRGGGEHHYFWQPDPPISFGRWSGGEVLGTSKFAVAYGMVDPDEVPELPAWVLKALPRAQRTPTHREAHTHIHREANINMRPVHEAKISSSEAKLSSDEARKSPSPTLSVPLRSKHLLRSVENGEPGNRNNLLHWSACRFGNMIGEGKMLRNVAEQLLVAAAKGSGLWREDGEAQCQATIKSGLDVGIEEMRK
jgi:Bifunctional DNA primase/polymerase, N-terminal